jgi:catechol 2,3-dioxygenase-like lactoylglutathione lyase family enzyme
VTSQINHVSINARDLDASVEFYIELLGAEPIPAPNFGNPVRWLAVGATQLHLYQGDVAAPEHHHLGITVDDLERPYRVAERRDVFDRKAFGNHLVLLPGDVVQLYVRDPAGNLVELDQSGIERLPDDVRRQVMPIWEINPQSEEQMRGRLFVGERFEIST